MTRHYSTKDSFRQMPNTLLTRFFQEHAPGADERAFYADL